VIKEVKTDNREKKMDNLKKQNQKRESDYFETQSRAYFITISLILVMLLGGIDYLTGYELSFSIFYLIPVSMATWYTGKWNGILLSFFSTLSWFLADVMSGHIDSKPFITYWNASASLGFFLIVTFILSKLKTELIAERLLAQTDFLTGISNSAYFSELVTWEINRCRRNMKPLTLIYIDCDNFKAVNDNSGHHAGNNLLCLVANTVKNTIRETDIVARLGGDEFGILLPETGAEQANSVVHKIQNNLMNAMQKDEWPITFSIGVATYIKSPGTLDEVIGSADRLMYAAKDSGKNAIKHEVFGSAPN
jgi:diguanylate cyclase (GGDEF)-like protein